MDEEQKKLAEELLSFEYERPSVAKCLYFGELDTARIFPFPSLPADEKKKLDTLIGDLKAFAEREIDADRIDREAKIPDSVVKGLAELGILGMTIPEEFGGLGMSQTAYCRVMETLSQFCSSTALFVNVHQSIGLKSILLFGTNEQKQTWLKPLARGDFTAAFALTEPNAGSDAGGVESVAEYDPGKKVFRINGQKQWITNGGIAKVLTVMAKLDGKVTAFLVTPEMPGFHIKTKALEKVGMRGTWTANLTFDALEVPEENVLGQKGKGLRVALTVLDYGRITFGATCTGMAKYCEKKAYEHAGTRMQFGQTLASFPLVQKKLAMMSAFTYAMDATTYLTAGLLDQGDHDIMLEAAMLKVFTSEASWDVLYDTMQIFGGRSFFPDHPFERLMRDARLNMIGEGSNDVLQIFIAAVGLRDVGLELKEMTSFPSGFWEMAKRLMHRFAPPKVPVYAKELKKPAKRLGQNVQSFGIHVLRMLYRYREGIVDKQLICERLAKAATALYTTAAVISRCDAEIREGDRGGLSAATLYCRLALEKVDRQLDALSENCDEHVLRVFQESEKSFDK